MVNYQIPEDLKDLIPGYILRRETDILELNLFKKSNDFDSIRKLAHRLTGNGSSFGFDRISEIGAQLTHSAERNDINTVTQLIENLEGEVSKIKDKLS